jgi:hypothetical protein
MSSWKSTTHGPSVITFMYSNVTKILTSSYTTFVHVDRSTYVKCGFVRKTVFQGRCQLLQRIHYRKAFLKKTGRVTTLNEVAHSLISAFILMVYCFILLPFFKARHPVFSWTVRNSYIMCDNHVLNLWPVQNIQGRSSMHMQKSGDMSRTVSLDHQVIKCRRYRGWWKCMEICQ